MSENNADDKPIESTGRKFEIDLRDCRGCRVCLRLECPAIELVEASPERPNLKKAHIIPELCTGCGKCFEVCEYEAIREE